MRSRLSRVPFWITCILVMITLVRFSPAFAEPEAEPVVEVATEPTTKPLPVHPNKTITLILDRTTPDLELSLDWADAVTGFIPSLIPVEAFAVTTEGVKLIPIKRNTSGTRNPSDFVPYPFTNIGSVLLKLASRISSKNDTQHHVIIINNGLGLNEDRFNEMRIALLQEPLTKANMIIHTISVNSPAGREQLAALSAVTDGWYEETRSATTTTRAALRLITGLSTPNQVPIVDNLFRVAPDTQSLHLILFQQHPTIPATLATPKLGSFSQYNAPPNVEWITVGDIAVVHIAQPDTGTWHIEAPPDNDHRAIVEHALRIVTNPIPRNVMQNRPMQLESGIAKGDVRIIPNNAFEPIQFRIRLLSRLKELRSWYPRDNGKYPDLEADDGIITIDLEQGLQAGIHRIIIEAETSEWQRQQILLIHSQEYPVALHREQVTHEKLGILAVTPRIGLMNPTTVVMDAVISIPEADFMSLQLTQTTPLIWQLDLDDIASQHPLAAELSFAASNDLGDSLSAWIDLFPFMKLSHSNENNNGVENTASPFGTTKLTEDISISETEQNNGLLSNTWLKLFWQVGIANVIVIVVFILGTWMWRKNERHWIEKIRGELTYD